MTCSIVHVITPHLKQSMKYVAFLPLRGGSKSLPGKNIQPIAGKPLALWSLEAASACAAVEAIFVATDDPRIRAVVESARLPRVHVIGRSDSTATDTASTESAMLEFAREHEFEHIILMQATSPLTTVEDLLGGINCYQTSGADSLLSAVVQKRFIWMPKGPFATPANYDPANRVLRQNFPPYFVENGAFYICQREALLRTGCRISGQIAVYAMPEETYYELDEPADWLIIENLLVARRRENDVESRFRALSNNIKLFLSDVDGVLTDAGMYYSECGDEIKKFNTRDGKGLEMLRLSGIKTGIVTSESTALVAKRGQKLRLDYLRQGATNKLVVLMELLAETGLKLGEVAYIGDDLNDLEIIKAVGFSACPADAVTEVKAVATYHCIAKGGEGCVREFAERVLSARNPVQ